MYMYMHVHTMYMYLSPYPPPPPPSLYKGGPRSSCWKRGWIIAEMPVRRPVWSVPVTWACTTWMPRLYQSREDKGERLKRESAKCVLSPSPPTYKCRVAMSSVAIAGSSICTRRLNLAMLTPSYALPMPATNWFLWYANRFSFTWVHCVCTPLNNVYIYNVSTDVGGIIHSAFFV